MGKRKGRIIKSLIVCLMTTAVIGGGIWVAVDKAETVKGWFGINKEKPTEKPPVDQIDPDKPLTYTITFDIEGEKTTKTVVAGGAIVPPELPTKEGQVFKGWLLEGQLVTNFENIKATKNMTFTASFIEALPYVFNGDKIVKYLGSESNIVTPTSYSLGDKVSVIEGNYRSIRELENFLCNTVNVTYPLTLIDNNNKEFLIENFEEFLEIRMQFEDDMTILSFPIKLKIDKQYYVAGNDIAVTAIGVRAFDNDAIQSVRVSEGVTKLESGPFGENIKSVILPNSLKQLPDYAFNNCVNLSNVELPEQLVSIGRNAFESCSSLKSINIPSTVSNIGEMAFCRTGLTNLTIPEGVVTIAIHAFDSCERLSVVRLPNSLTTLGDFAFHNCTNLTTINIPNSLSIIGNNLFENCTSLTNISLPSSITEIKYRAFANSGLTEVIIPKNVSFIGEMAFTYCENLTSIDLPENYGFAEPNGNVYYLQNCQNLEKLVIRGPYSDAWSNLLVETNSSKQINVYVSDEFEQRATNNFILKLNVIVNSISSLETGEAPKFHALLELEHNTYFCNHRAVETGTNFSDYLPQREGKVIDYILILKRDYIPYNQSEYSEEQILQRLTLKEAESYTVDKNILYVIIYKEVVEQIVEIEKTFENKADFEAWLQAQVLVENFKVTATFISALAGEEYVICSSLEDYMQYSSCVKADEPVTFNGKIQVTNT